MVRVAVVVGTIGVDIAALRGWRAAVIIVLGAGVTLVGLIVSAILGGPFAFAAITPDLGFSAWILVIQHEVFGLFLPNGDTLVQAY